MEAELSDPMQTPVQWPFWLSAVLAVLGGLVFGFAITRGGPGLWIVGVALVGALGTTMVTLRREQPVSEGG